MKGKYITTSLMLAVLAGGKHGISILCDETQAVVSDHKTIWSKQHPEKQHPVTAGIPDELKLA